MTNIHLQLTLRLAIELVRVSKPRELQVGNKPNLLRKPIAKINRRMMIMGTASSFGSLRLYSAALGFSVVGNREASAEIVATITAIAAVVTAVSSLANAGDTGGTDPATQEYMERIIANQEEIAGALSDVSIQVQLLHDLTNAIPATTVELDERVEAGAILRTALFTYSGFLGAGGNFGPTDRAAFDTLNERVQASASRHLSIAERVGQSYDLIASLDVLRICLNTIASIAGRAGYVGEDDKRRLMVSAELIETAFSKINVGRIALGSFDDPPGEPRTHNGRYAELSNERDEIITRIINEPTVNYHGQPWHAETDTMTEWFWKFDEGDVFEFTVDIGWRGDYSTFTRLPSASGRTSYWEIEASLHSSSEIDNLRALVDDFNRVNRELDMHTQISWFVRDQVYEKIPAMIAAIDALEQWG